MASPDKTYSVARHLTDAKRVTWAGLVVNLVLCAFKFVSGIIGNSQAVVADAVHTLSDVSTDVAVLVGMRYWSVPPDRTHPHGHRRIETMITILIGVALAAVASGLLYDAMVTLAEKHNRTPGWIALVAAAVSIVSKEAMYRWTAHVGKRIKSTALIANAWHHRTDAFSSIPVVLAVAGARLIPEWAFLDHVGAILVSVFIIVAAWKIGWPAVNQLVDRGAPEKVLAIQAVTLAVTGVQRVHAVRTRLSGSALMIDLHVIVDGNLTVRDGHDISEQVKQRLMAEDSDVVDVVVHLEPDAEGTEPE